MPAITFDRFDGGMDRRKAQNVSDANRLWDAKNVYITDGWKIAKRPGLKFIWAFGGTQGDVKGLFNYNGKLNTVSEKAITHPGSNPSAVNWQLTPPAGEVSVSRLEHVEIFNGYPYVSVTWSPGLTTRHYYLNGSPPHAAVADVNCPHHKSFVKAASKIFSPGTETVPYSKTNDPTDWTTAGDAGFLPTGIQASGDATPVAVARYNDQVAVLHSDATQLWNVDPDPTLMALDQVLDVGTDKYRGFGNIGGDLIILTGFGFRSISLQQQTLTNEDVDIGSPIDALVRADLAAGDIPAYAYSTIYRRGGQFMILADSTSNPGFTRAYVLSLSRIAKLTAWTYYDFGLNQTGGLDLLDAVELDGVLYFNRGNADVYALDDTVSADNGIAFQHLALMPYLSFKKPGQRKRVLGLDVAMQGRSNVSVLYDANDTSRVAALGELSGDSRPGGVIPVEVAGSELALQFDGTHTEAWQHDLATVYYDLEGVT